MLKYGPKVLLALLAAASLIGCTNLLLGIANAPTRFGEFQQVSAVSYGSQPRQKLDVYAPHNANNMPVIVFWYGGSFERGARQQYRFVGAALAEAGFVAVLPDYRVYPAARFPEFAQDAALAVRWVRDNATTHGGDPTRIFLMGHSAGAYLATLTALDRRYLQQAGAGELTLRGVIALSGPHVLTPNTAVLNRIFAPPWRLADWQPVTYANALAPPMLLIHGERDTLVGPEQSSRLAKALRSAGAPVQLELLSNAKHADTVAAISRIARRRGPVLEKVIEFVRQQSAN